MTTKQFWMKLDQLAQRKDKASVPEEVALILIDAFVDGLDILIACSYDGESTGQLYSYRTSPDIDRELLCYTRKGIALADPNLEGSLTWRSHPVRQVMLNAVTRKEYIGLLFKLFTLVPGRKIAVPAIKEYPLTLECKVLYRQDQVLESIPDTLRQRFYGMGTDDFHTAYIGEIVDAYVVED